MYQPKIPHYSTSQSKPKKSYLWHMLEILFGISFSLFGGNLIDTKLKHHKYEKEDYKEVFYLKNKESVNIYCVKHCRLENVLKKKIY